MASARTARIIVLVLLALDLALIVFGPQLKEHLLAIHAAEAAGKRPDWWDDAALGLRYAAWINAALLVALLATSKWWTRPLPQFRIPNSEFRTLSWFWPLTIIAILTCLGLRLPLASKSLWWDEAWVIQQASHGKWTPDKKHPGELKFSAHDWSRCAWYYQKPTNHAPMSLLQKASITTWQKLIGAKREQFTDLAARVPALLASCIAVGMMACLLRAWKRPGAGIAAAFLLAAHPWAIRYGVDARAYALVIPLCISGMFAVTRIVESRGSKMLPWLWWGFTEFLWLWASPNAVFDIVALNIGAAWLLWRGAEKVDRGAVMWRLVATNVFAAMCFVQMFLPNLMQARRWAGQEADKHVLDGALAESTMSQLFFGGESQQASSPAVKIVMIALALICFGLPVFRLWRAKGDSRAMRVVLACLALSSLAFALTTMAAQSYFYPRFIIAFLPVLIASLVIEVAPQQDEKEASENWLKAVLRSLVLSVIILWMWAPQLRVLLAKPYSPLHEVASFIKADAKSSAKVPLVVCYGLGREVMPVYYPAAMPVETKPDLERVIEQAKAEQRPLYVTYGYDTFNRSTENEPHRVLAAGFEVLDDRARFEEMKSFKGLETDFTFHVLKGR